MQINKNLSKKDLLHRLLRMILPMVMLSCFIIGASFVSIKPIGAQNRAEYAQATVDEVPVDNSSSQEFSGTQKVLATITSGKYSGEQCTLVNSNTYNRGALCYPGTKIIALIESDGGVLTGSVYNYDRTGMVYILLAIFALAVILIGGKKGIAALYALIYTFICIICIYIPLIYVGTNGILASVISSIIILVGSIYIINGWSGKTLCAIIGTMFGVVVSGLTALAAGIASNLSGFNMSDVESMVYISDNTGVDVASLLYAGILISSLGAVMDVSVSVVASMKEIYDKTPSLTSKELFASGMRVGRDMMGTMSNTLILAYTGSATGVLLTVYSYEMPYLQIMGYNSIIVELVCGLCGTLGVILTVPIQAFVTSILLKTKIFQK